MQEKRLKSIDRKLSAVVALVARQLGGGGTKGIESIPRRSGMSTAEVGNLLGKSQRAVQLSHQEQGFKE